jgi:hypothetical protein
VPRQVRCIVFSREEVVSALVEHRRRRERPLPPGHLERIVTGSGAAGTFAHLRLRADADQETILVAFDNAEIREALIGFCRSRHIPLARRAEKRVTAQGSGIALIATLNLGLGQDCPSGP